MMHKPVCPVCEHQNSAAATVCAECGAPLLALPPGVETEPVPDMDSIPTTRFRPTRRLAPGTLSIFVGEAKDPVVFDVATRRLLLGRDLTPADLPGIDLGPYNGHGHGVSRHHAVVRQLEGRFVLEDVGSTNGTWVGEERLQPFHPHPLISGDPIRLGRLVLHVMFASADQTETLYLRHINQRLGALTLADWQRLVQPYMTALGAIQTFADDFLGRGGGEIAIQSLQINDAILCVRLVGAREAARFVKTQLASQQATAPFETTVSEPMVNQLVRELLRQLAPDQATGQLNLATYTDQLAPHLHFLATNHLGVIAEPHSA